MWKFESYKASWLESFNLLKPENITLLLLVSLRSLLIVYRSLLYAWFLPLTLLVGLVLNMPRLLGAFYITVLTKAARPSMERKRVSYWQKPVFADWIIFFGVLILLNLPQLLAEMTHPALKVIRYIYDFALRLFFITGQVWFPGTETLGLLTVFLSPFVILWALFILDAQTGFSNYVKALGRAALMLSYNYPFFLIVYALLRIGLSAGYIIGQSLVGWVSQFSVVGWFLLLVVIIPYWVCFITNFYVKRVHEQFQLYYGR